MKKVCIAAVMSLCLGQAAFGASAIEKCGYDQGKSFIPIVQSTAGFSQVSQLFAAINLAKIVCIGKMDLANGKDLTAVQINQELGKGVILALIELMPNTIKDIPGGSMSNLTAKDLQGLLK